MSKKEEEEWLSEQNLLRMLGVTEKTVRSWREKGCPYQHVNGRKRYQLNTVVRWHSQNIDHYYWWTGYTF